MTTHLKLNKLADGSKIIIEISTKKDILTKKEFVERNFTYFN